MFQNFITKMTAYLLKKNLSLKNRTILTTALLKNLVAIQSCDIIKTNEEGKLAVNGRELDFEGAKILRESAISALDNQAWKFVKEQVEFEAVKIGVHFGDTPEKVFFSKAAIWQGLQVEEFLKKLAQM